MRLNVRWPSGSSAYIILSFLLLASAATGLLLAWTSFGLEFDNYAYDFLFRLEPPAPWQPSSIILAIDETTLAQYGYPAGLRAALADGLNSIQPFRPAVIAVDAILADCERDNRDFAAVLGKTGVGRTHDRQRNGGRIFRRERRLEETVRRDRQL